MTDTPKRTGPLAGVKIVDMSSVVLGPFATLIFGDLGADVVKIESAQPGKAGDTMRYAGKSPTGDLGPIYTSLNRNKKSVQLNAKTDEGKAAIVALLKDADVFFHNVRLAGMARLGLDYESVKAINPSIVYVHCAGFGVGGPYEHRQAYDDLIQGASGFSHLSVMRDGSEPAYAPSLVADKTVGLFAINDISDKFKLLHQYYDSILIGQLCVRRHVFPLDHVNFEEVTCSSWVYP